MSLLNLGKFTTCLSRYKDACDRSTWKRSELPKFYFANILNRRVNLTTQDPRTVFQICDRIQEKDYYLKETESRICGIQFLPGSGRQSYSEPIAQSDAQLFIDLVHRNWDQDDLARKTISFNAFTGWAGTLLPKRFLPVTSNHFRHTIAYLFDQELKIYMESDWDYFLHAQKHFLLTKKRLREFGLESLYLADINEYLRIAYPKCVIKREFDEYDWNWLTQDFHLFVYREILGLDTVGPQHFGLLAPPLVTKNTGRPFDIAEILGIYVP